MIALYTLVSYFVNIVMMFVGDYCALVHFLQFIKTR